MPAKGRVEINEKYCKGCELCVEACPPGVLGLSKQRLNAKGYHPAELIAAGCTGCGVCTVVCPEAAIEVFRVVSARAATA
ncbi:MAG: 4Fe-4S dicluster domain-containing protein [Chloroflexi bacterium]|nr:4Fe-4S dicluster domain-containing protein [Anaerolineaceae bacterium]NMB89129.1 4Fe-4S dicluster domain-containing protein [Chloroflexota bacterium]